MMIPSMRTIRGLQSRFEQLDKALSVSFANLKRDLAAQAEEIAALKTKAREHDRAIRKLEEQIGQTQEPYSKDIQRSEERRPLALSPLNLRILKHLMLLQVESGRRVISLRELAEELYPQKPYASIKTTMSRYIKRLEQKGLIKKTYNGRLYLSYTEKALEFADSERLNRMRELISQQDR